MIRYLATDTNNDADREQPQTDDRDVTELIPAAVDQVLESAEAWLGWDGRPVLSDGNAWTPHKALRRVTDHLIDHLAEIECRLAGMATLPDQWHGRKLTTHADFACFTEADLDEATSRLRRIAACYQSRLAGLSEAELDRGSEGWTIRQVVHHVANITYYAERLAGLDDGKKDRA
jgi:hypothetical protein